MLQYVSVARTGPLSGVSTFGGINLLSAFSLGAKDFNDCLISCPFHLKKVST